MLSHKAVASQPDFFSPHVITIRNDMEYDPLRLAENIVLLQKSCNKPIPPTSNPLPVVEEDDDRQISLEIELEIVECLTYLVAYSDDADRVMALCTEERENGSGMTISIATNTGSTTYLQQGLRSICEILERQAKCSTATS